MEMIQVIHGEVYIIILDHTKEIAIKDYSMKKEDTNWSTYILKIIYHGWKDSKANILFVWED